MGTEFGINGKRICKILTGHILVFAFDAMGNNAQFSI